MTTNDTLTTHELAKKMRELLTPKAAWIQGENALDSNGNDVSPRDPEAVCWCLNGAKMKFDEDNTDRELHDILVTYARLEDVEDGAIVDDFVDFNDLPTTTHADILAFLDKVIQRTAFLDKVIQRTAP